MSQNTTNECPNEEERCCPTKKPKIQIENSVDSDDSVHAADINLSSFEVTKILNNNYTRKQICLQGTFKGRDYPAVVLLEKKNFPVEELFLKRGFFNESTILRKLFRNDIYGNYECFPTREYNGLNATIIHPATLQHIEKFKKKELHIVEETYELYKKIIVPYIESGSFSLEWIENILNHKAEEDKIIYEDKNKNTGFVLVADLKWDGEVGTLKLLALPFQKINSIRDLNDSHLPLLKNIRDAGTIAITSKYNVPASQLRIYFHYQPSYYYLHVHFCYLMFESQGSYVEKAHLLSTVIRNIELMPDYYTKAVLTHTVSEKDPLFLRYKELGILKETISS